MTELRDRIDRLVAGYLGLVERALDGVPEAHRVELLTDLREHIEAERADLSSESEAAVRGILDRLGDPEEIAAAARAEHVPAAGATTETLGLGAGATGQTLPPYPGAVAYPATATYPAARWSPARSGRLGPLGWSLIVAAVVVVLGCGMLLLFGLFAGSSSLQEEAPAPAVSSVAPTSSPGSSPSSLTPS